MQPDVSEEVRNLKSTLRTKCRELINMQLGCGVRYAPIATDFCGAAKCRDVPKADSCTATIHDDDCAFGPGRFPLSCRHGKIGSCTPQASRRKTWKADAPAAR